MMQRAQFELHALLTDHSLFSWEMDNPDEILPYASGIKFNAFEKGIMDITSTSEDPLFFLNTHKRLISPEDDTLQLRFYSSRRGDMQIYYKTIEAPDYIFASSFTPIKAGWQTIELALHQLQWQSAPASENRHPPQAPEPAWSKRHSISNLRIDLSWRDMLHLQVDYIRLFQAHPPAIPDIHHLRIIDDYKKFSSPNDIIVLNFAALQWPEFQHWQETQGKSATLFINATAWQTMEVTHQYYLKLKRLAPRAILFPYLLTAEQVKDIAQQVSVSGNQEWQPVFVRHADTFQNTMLALIALNIIFILAIKKWALPYTALGFCILFISQLALLWSITLPPYPLVFYAGLSSTIATIFFFMQHLGGNMHDNTGFTRPSFALYKRTALLSLPPLIGIIIIAWTNETPAAMNVLEVILRFGIYLFWALIQQFILGPVLAQSLLHATSSASSTQIPRIVASGIAGVIFSLMHFPNFSLMIPTVYLGFAWAYLFLQYRSILPLALAHAILGTAFCFICPPELRLDGNVGPSFYFMF